MKFRYALALCLMMVIGCDKVDRYPDLTPDKPSVKPETPKKKSVSKASNLLNSSR